MSPGVTHTHYLIVGDGTAELEVHALPLALVSRGRYALAGGQMRGDRDVLAGLLYPGVLSELLISDRPIRVDSIPDGYVIEEL